MFAVAGLVYGETPVVTSINVNRIGWGGGMVVITGEGFATDAFSQFDPTKGNKVGNIQYKITIPILTLIFRSISGDLLQRASERGVSESRQLELLA